MQQQSVPMFTVDELLRKYYPQITSKPWLNKTTGVFLRYLLKENEMNAFAEHYPHLQGLDFVEQVLEYFHFSYSVRDSEKEHIPPQGKVVIIANHPLGTLDGLALIKLISSVRKDIKIVTNEMMTAFKPLHPLLLPLNKPKRKRGWADRGAVETGSLDDIQNHLHNEGALIIFPAGEVSRLKPQGIRDSRWHNSFLRAASEAKAPILPIFIDGKNSPLFYTISMLYKPLATLLLVREMFKQRTKHLPVRIGELIGYDSYSQTNISSDQKVKLFKKHLYRVGNNKPVIFNTQKAIAQPENTQELVQAIKQCEKLGSTGDGKDIYLYQYQGSSPILREIGRLREVAFRAVGEGTNRRRDIDQYDNDYYHLILWDNNDLEIVGAYRFGDAKKLHKKREDCKDKGGLYSATLFNYHPTMQPYFEQGLELGRSFVQPKYWGKRSLDYLWYGIGAFLRSRPQYRYLFGPVSLSDSLPDTAKDLIVCFYQQYFSHKQVLAESNHPYRLPTELKNTFSGDNYREDFATLKHLLSNIGATVPTLYKQYTEVCEPGGVHFLSFGVDPDFNYCIDGLVLADLSMLKAKKRQRYIPD